MKRRFVLQCVVLAALPSLNIVAATAKSPASVSDLTRELMLGLSLPQNFVIAATGALLNIARRRLAVLEFSDISGFLPGTLPLLHQAAQITSAGLPSSIGEMPNLVARFGLPVDTTNSCQEFILSYLRERDGRKIAGLLRSAWRN
ncbi:MAG: hypothetical protein RL412_1331 [Pseudomonadota bacterium]|jgi:hypothetical protein